MNKEKVFRRGDRVQRRWTDGDIMTGEVLGYMEGGSVKVRMDGKFACSGFDPAGLTLIDSQQSSLFAADQFAGSGGFSAGFLAACDELNRRASTWTR